jgi:16S rRNA (guanine966-N2)-methyltransferase
MLTSRLGSFEGLRVADLFAGSGGLGLEALSRGAAHCTFVENDRLAVDSLKSNLASLGATERAEVLSQSVEHLPDPATRFDLIFLDPPYGTGLAQRAIDHLAAGSWLAPGAWLSLEIHKEVVSLPSELHVAAERRFGKATIILIQKPSRALS